MSTVQDAPPTAEATTLAEGIPRPYEFTATVFDRMLEAEVFHDEDRVELWDGQVVLKMAKSIPHVGSGIKVLMTLAPLLPPGWCLSGENPVSLGPKTTPLPDFAILRGTGDDYSVRRALPTDVGLVVELSASSVKEDTTVKLVHYARAGIPTYWVVNLVRNVVQVYEQPVPSEGRYASEQTFAVGQSIPLRLDGVLVAEIPAVDLLPVSR